MTAPASLYQMEKARRGIELPRATGCPRSIPVQQKIERSRTVRTAPPPANPDATKAKYRMWQKWYEEDRLSVTEIGQKAGVKPQSVSRGLRKLGTVMRKKGHAEMVARLQRENAALRGRINHYRHLLKQYQPEAM